MNTEKFDKGKLVEHWLSCSDDDYETMLIMFAAKRYNWSLFVGHLMIEKLLKAFFVKSNEEYPPFSHNLLKLAVESKLEISDELKLQLTTITAFNINGRYDDYKNSFQKKCTSSFTKLWIEKIINIRVWIKEQIK